MTMCTTTPTWGFEEIDGMTIPNRTHWITASWWSWGWDRWWTSWRQVFA